ncbi:MAG: nucleoside monophosphate kinase [Candidatus Pacebacteria bacterium]|nr:nucleoside monophosphate kinase [Candidatus Paceibacterota bacterium]
MFIPKAISVLGRAGCGKGTQSDLLVEKFGLEYFGSGESLRARAKKADFTGKKTAEVMAKGELVPAFVISNLWMDALEELKQKKGFKGIVFDGTPRKLAEAKFLEDALKWYEWDKNRKVVLIEVSEKESFNRLTKRRQCEKCKKVIPWIGDFKKMDKCHKCGGKLIFRTDDKPTAIRKRLAEYKSEVVPVIHYYNLQEKLVRVNGEQSIEDVFKDILKAIQ